VFNHEDSDVINSTWRTLCARLEQANNPLIMLGPECWSTDFFQAILRLSQEYRTALMVSEEFFGRLGLFEPEGMRGFYQLDAIDPEDLFEFDSLFLFGVPADYRVVEHLTMYHDLSDVNNVDLFILNSTALIFGDGRDSMPPLCMKEFFAHAPPPCTSAWPSQNILKVEESPLWYRIVNAIKLEESALFIENDSYVVSFFIQHQPFAKIFIQPEDSDESWFWVAPIAYNNAMVPIFIAGTTDTVLRVMENRIYCLPNNSVILLHDEGSSEDFLDGLPITILEEEQMAIEWRLELKGPALILV
jgi:hypothetical protein